MQGHTTGEGKRIGEGQALIRIATDEGTTEGALKRKGEAAPQISKDLARGARHPRAQRDEASHTPAENTDRVQILALPRHSKVSGRKSWPAAATTSAVE